MSRSAPFNKVMHIDLRTVGGPNLRKVIKLSEGDDNVDQKVTLCQKLTLMTLMTLMTVMTD